MPVANHQMSVSDLEIRDLQLSDYHNGFLECLAFLTAVGQISESQFIGIPFLGCARDFFGAARYELLKSRSDLFRHKVVVDRRTGTIVGAGTLLIEPKFIHQCAFVQGSPQLHA